MFGIRVFEKVSQKNSKNTNKFPPQRSEDSTRKCEENEVAKNEEKSRFSEIGGDNRELRYDLLEVHLHKGENHTLENSRAKTNV